MHITCINVKQKGVQPIDERTNYFSGNCKNESKPAIFTNDFINSI